MLKKRQIFMIGALLTLLFFGMLLPAAPTQAIGEITPTPNPTEFFDPEAAIDRAIGMLQEGDTSGAIEQMDMLLEIDPTNSDAYIIRGVAYVREGRYNRAIDDYTRAIEIVPYDWTTYTFRGDAYVQVEEFGFAMMDYDRAIYLNPRYEPAYRSRSILKFFQRNEQGAFVDELVAQGLSRAAFGDTEEAVELYTEAIETAEDPIPELANAYYNRALTVFGEADWDVIIDDLTEALELQPEMHDSYLARGIAYQESGDTQSAGEDFIRRIELLEMETIEDSLDAVDEVTMSYGTVYRLSFEGEEGQVITATARAAFPDEETVDPLIVILGPDGNAIAGDDDFGGELDSQVAEFELPEDGTYILVISHANGGYDGMVDVSVVEE